MRTTFTSAPTPLNAIEVAALRCQLRSGIAPTVEEGLRLLATIDSLQAAIHMQAGRIEDAAEVGS